MTTAKTKAAANANAKRADAPAAKAAAPAPEAKPAAPAAPAAAPVASQGDDAATAGRAVESAAAVSAEITGDKPAPRKDQADLAADAGNAAIAGYEDLIAFNRDNAEAVIKAGMVLAMGLHDVQRSALALAHEQFAAGIVAGKALLGAKTLQEVVEIQTGLAKDCMEKAMTEGGRFREVSAHLAEQAAAPLNGRFAAIAERTLAPRP